MLKSLLLSAAIHLPESLAQYYTGPAQIIDARKRDLKAQILGEIFELTRTPISSWKAQEIRQNLELAAGVWDLYPVTPTYTAHDLLIDQQNPANHPIRIRHYQPDQKKIAPSVQQPAILYFHGGGMVIGSTQTHDALCARLCQKSNLSVFSVNYRLAPEHLYPAALEDVQQAYHWLIKEAPNLNLDAHKMVLAGDSAGANLVAALLHQLQAAQTRPLPKAQLLIYPWIDLHLHWDSFKSLAKAPVIDTESIRWFRDQYLPKEHDLKDPCISPLYSPYLSNQPPAYILTCGHDPLRDMGQAYTQKLSAAGVAVTEIEYPGQIHGFLQFARVIPEAETALEKIVIWLQTTL